MLFLLYLPIFGAVPRLASVDLREGHVLWVPSLLMMCSCLAAFCRWVWQGPSSVLRGLWFAAIVLAMAGYVPALLLAVMSGHGSGRG